MGVKERYEQRKKEGKVSSSYGVAERYKAKEAESAASAITDRVNTWLQNHNNYLSNYQSRYRGRKGGYEDSYVSDSASWLETVKGQKSNFDAEADSILSYMDQYKDYLDADWMDSVKSVLREAGGTQDKILSGAIQDNAYWESWGTEDKVKEYGSAENAYKQAAKVANINNMSSAEIKAMMDDQALVQDDVAIIEDLMRSNMPYSREYAEQDGRDMGIYAEVEANRQYISEKYGVDLTYDNYDGLATLLTNLNNQSDSSVAYTTADGQNVTWQRLYDHKTAAEDLANRIDTYSKNADWDTLSKDRDVSADPNRKKDYDIVFELSRSNVAYDKETALANGTSEAEWNDIEQKRRYVSEKYGVDLYSNIYNNINVFNEIMKMLDDKSLESGELSTQLHEDILGEQTFKNMRHLNNEEKAVLNYIFNTQGRDAALQWHNSRMGIYQDRANGVLAEEMFNFGKNSWGGLGAFVSPQSLSSVALSIGSGFEQVGDWLTGDSNNTLARASSAIRSGVSSTTDVMIGNFDAFDFVYNTAMSGADSLASSLLPGKAGGVVLGLSAAAQATNDAIDRGLSNKQAFWSGLSSGVFEMVFERVSIGEFKSLKEVSAKRWKDIAKNLSKSMLVNASEETATEIANLFYDNFVNGDLSQYETMIRQYEAQGMSPEKARSKALGNTFGQVAEAAASGALMGFGFGTIGSAGSAWNITKNSKTEKAKQAQFMNKRYNDTVAKAKTRLTELGEEGNVDDLAQIAAKRATGQSLTRAERSTITSSQFGTKVAKELREANLAEYSNKTDSKPATYKSLEDRVGEETTFKVSEDGQTTDSKTGEGIDLSKAEVAEFVKDKEGNIVDMVLNVGGKQVKASEVDYADGNQSYLFEAVSKIENISPRTATSIIQTYDPTSGQSAGEYLNGVDEAFTYGYNNYSEADMKAGDFAPKLTDTQMKRAYVLGQNERSKRDADSDAPAVKMRTAAEAKETAEEKTAKQKAKIESEDTEVYFRDGKKVVKFDDHTGKYDPKRMVAVNTAKFLSKLGIGGKYYFYESYMKDGVRVYKDTNGKEVEAPNGIYMEADGSIHIDLNAGNAGQGTALFTLGHELTHFVKDQSKKQFKILGDLVTEAFDKTDISMHERVLEKQKFLESKRGKAVSYAEAHEEVVADAMSTMLSDGSFYDLIMDIRVKDKGLFATIKRFFKDKIAKFTKEYAKLKPDQREAQDIREMKDMFDKIQKAFAEALVEASDNFQATQAQKNTTEDGGVEEVKESIRRTQRMTLKDQLSAYYKKQFKRSDAFYFGITPGILSKSGLDAHPLAFAQDDFVKSTRNKHNIPRRVLNNLSENLQKPIFSFTAGKQAGIVIDDIDGDGKPVVVAIHGGHNMDRNPVNLIKSIYGIDSMKEWVAQQIEGGCKFRVYDIEKANAMLQTEGYLAEVGTQSDGFWDIITEKKTGVNTESTEAMDVEMDAKTESVAPTVLKSERTWTESDYVQEREQAAKEISKAIGVSVKKAKAYIDSVNSIAKMIAEDRGRLDYFSSPGRSSFVSNVEYGGSFDFSTLCKKRRLLTGTFTAIQKALPNTALTADEILKIRNRMKDAGLEVSCGLCYVEGSRANMGQFAKEFLKLYKQYYPDAWQPNMADVNTPDGIEWVRINHPECYEQYEYFWNHYGTLKPGDKNLFASQQKPKLYQLHTEYKGEILDKFNDDDNVEEKNLNGGIRLQSFSDFEIVHLIDTMQIIMDMSRVGLAGQAYTKVPDFAWALGDTGLKINLSLIAKGVDENGKLIFDDVEGMPIAEAMKLRDRYSKNVGTILVAFNDEQLLAAMADERVDFIIPFHRSQWKKSQYEAMGLPAKTKDYTYMQNEKFIKPQYHEYRGRMVKDKATNYMPNEYWDFSKSGKENAEAYLEMCARNNKRPKFYKLLQNNGDGSYSLKADGSTDGYWKLLIDFKMYDNEGNGSPQMAVKPEFNMDEANRMLETYKGGHSNFPVAQGIVDGFVKDYKASHKGALHSDRDLLADDNLKSNYTVSEISEMFDSWNSNADTAVLAKKVFAKLQSIQDEYTNADWGKPYGIRFATNERMEKAFYHAPLGVFKAERSSDFYGITYNLDRFKNLDNQRKANVLLHEAIHACTVNYIKSAESRIPKHIDVLNFKAGEDWSNEAKAGLTLIQIFEQIRTAENRTEYGQKDAYEMTAELANPEFRALLKKQGLWDRVVNAIKRILGIESKTNALDAAAKALDQILEINNRENEDIRYSERNNAPVFYSQMGKVVEGMKQEKFGASSVISMLRGRGVKAEEIRWSGIQAFLDGKKSVTKAELLDFINGSMLHIEEETRSVNKTRDEFVQAWRNFVDQDLDESEILAGLDSLDEMEAYLESLVEDEELNRYYANYILELAQKVGNKADMPAKWDSYKLEGGANYRELVFKMPGADYTNHAMQAHWGADAEGVLAHARMQDFDTAEGKMLFIEEIQSDWHNQGQKDGYRKANEKTVEQLRKESEKAYEVFYNVVEKMVYDNADWENDNTVYYAHPVVVAEMFDGDESHFERLKFTDEQKETIRAMVAEEAARKAAWETAPASTAAPDAPFKENYHEYVLKRLIRMAAEEGYDSIGWTTAGIQMERWNPGRQTNEMMGLTAKNPNAVAFEDGYRIEYDQDMPKFLKRYGKQWDAEVGKTDIQTKQLSKDEEAKLYVYADILEDGESYIRDRKGIKEVWSMAITDSMKDSVLKEGQALYSERTGDSVSNRHLLANAFEGLSQSSVEYQMIQDYKEQIKVLNLLDEQLSELNAEIHEIRFTKGKYDAKKLQKLEEKAERIARDINKQDKVLIRMETSEPLRKVIEFERKKAAQKTKEHIAEIQQNKKLKAEQTELRHKIRKTVRDLDKILNRGNKKQNVKEDMQGFVSKALELADYLFTDHISNDELIRRGITVRMTPQEAALVKETEDIISQLYDNTDNLTDEEFTELDAKRKANEAKLRDLLTAQRNERLSTPVYNLFNDLVTEYASLKNSAQEAVKGAYDPKVEEFLRSYLGETTDGTDSDRKTLLQNMRLADMTTEELWKLHNAYTMVLHSVRTANKLFVNGKTESLEQMANRIVADFSKRKAPDGKAATVIRNLSNKLGWDYEKLYYALDRIGSEAFTELVMNLANSENTVMEDVKEAKAFLKEIVNKYDFNSWDYSKEIDRDFLDTTGKKFRMTLGQLMSLYAYSRREGAWDHIEYGGFVFGEAALTNPKPADSYKLSKDQCEAITNTLTKEQKAYVEDMQKFLSETMGAKGNEVSMLLYGIKMFGEKNYFPIHIAGQFKAQANEAQAKAAAGFGTMTNAGFTHAQNPNAKAPFVLEGFNEIWADHVNEMSRYHGAVPALEDMRRVMNRSSYSEADSESMAIKQLMENSFGKEAVEYFDNLYREANSGAITDKMQKVSKKFLSLFRKNSVAYSLSVVIQQPSAMARAYAMIDKKHFGFKGVGALTSGVAKAVSSKWNPAYANAYKEMLKYAPGVTMAKEIGGFDTHTGSSIREYLLDTEKSFKQSMKTENLKGKGKAVLDLVDDNAIANLPNVADKIAWIEIWNACKRETVAKHKDLAVNSDEFMQAVGERFTEVIRATQVYDSIFAKSPMLKSKYIGVQYLVSFMNEPNTTANMVEKAVRDAVNGNWKGGLRIAGAVTYSIIFNNVLKAIVYAMRDDDEDETYIEKYIAAVTGGMMDDFNPINYVPIARDVLSKARGFDVERPDMAIISDAIDAYQAIAKVKGKDTEGMTDEDLAELDKKITEASWKLVGSLAAFFGIPVKNIHREIEAVINQAKIAFENAGMTTANSLWDKVKEEVLSSVPFVSTKETKTDKLYGAIVGGDAKYIERIKGTYKSEDSYQSAVRKALRENDPRIHEAAQARVDGNTEEYKRLFREIKDEGKFAFDDIMSAVNSEESKIRKGVDPEKATSEYTANGYVEAIATGNTTEAMAMKDDIVASKVANGKTQEEAEKEFKSSVATGIGEAYSSGLLDEAQAEKMLVEYAGKDEEEAASKVGYWSFCEDNPAYKDVFTESHVAKYHEFAEPADVSVEVYAQFINGTKGLADVKDEWGDVEVTKREQVLEVIDSLDLTWQQKDALYLAAGYSESKIWDVPW